MTDADRPSSLDVRLWETRAIRGKKRTTYRVRWEVAGREHGRSFAGSGLAKGFLSKLTTSVSRGIAFDVESGWPVTMLDDWRATQARKRGATPAAEPDTWLSHAVDFVDDVWAGAAPGHRKNIAEALAHVTPAFIRPGATGQPAPAPLRAALRTWWFDARTRLPADPPPEPSAHLADAAAWIAENTVPVGALADDDLIRAALALIARTVDGKPAAASTVAWKRSALYSCLDYAVERKRLDHNPLPQVRRRRRQGPRSRGDAVDRRVVCNPAQAAALIAAVGELGEMGLRAEAFFGGMYYSALRPEELNDLTETDLEMPETDDEWGWFLFDGADPETGAAWSDTGRRGSRPLKHRAEGDTRRVPMPPPQVTLLRAHLKEFPPGEDGKVFTSTRGGPLKSNTLNRLWKAARQAALTPVQVASPLARRPYDLRHACVSRWLNGHVRPTQCADWAGHTVAVLFRVYAKCVDGDVVSDLARDAAALGLDAAAGTAESAVDPGAAVE